MRELHNQSLSKVYTVENPDRILNIVAYKFVGLDELSTQRAQWLARCDALQLKGTVLLSPEGINIMLAGKPEAILSLQREIHDDPRFADMPFKESLSDDVPFERMLVKIKPEIISFGIPGINPREHTATHLPPETLKAWLDERRDIVLLDTRNDYEVQLGSFDSAVHLGIQRFRQFPEALAGLDKTIKDKPVVTFCTGGIRCEKASELLLRGGFREVYQIDGGILNYFEQCGGAHWHGDCFVYDERIALDPQLNATHTCLCRECQQPLAPQEDTLCAQCAAQEAHA